MNRSILLNVFLLVSGITFPAHAEDCCEPAGRFLFMELKDPTRKLFGMAMVVIDFDKREIRVNDWGHAFESCGESENDMLRLLCKTVAETESLSRVDSRDAFGNIDVCRVFPIAGILKGDAELVGANGNDPVGFVACQDDPVNPSMKLSMVIFEYDEIGALYVDLLDPESGKVIEEQVFIAQGERMKINVPITE